MFERFDGSFIRRHLLTREAYMPYAVYENREWWQGLAAPVREEMVRRGEGWLDYEWPSLLATRYMDFYRNGDRMGFEANYHRRRVAVIDMMIAECIEGKGRFIDQLINGLWLICEETSWTLPAHAAHDHFLHEPLPDVEDSPRDLMACECGALLAVVYRVLGERLSRESARLTQRIQREVLRRIVHPLTRLESKWMGLDPQAFLNNWTPWCLSTSLTAVLLLGENEALRRTYVQIALHGLERFAAIYGEDGGCDEGPSYWSKAAGAFFDALTVLFDATGGALNVFDNSKVKAMGLYLPKMYIAGSWFVNFADCTPTLSPAPATVYRFGMAVGSRKLADFGGYLARLVPERALSHNYSVLEALGQLGVYEAMMNSGSWTPPRESLFGDIQVMTARRGELFLAVKGGHNGESHNHNDVASFVLYYRGAPALIDAGTLTYTAQTFSPRRYEIWTMDSSYHNLPDFAGKSQLPGREYGCGGTEYRPGAELFFAVDAAAAWGRGVKEYRRAFRLSGRSLAIGERYALEDAGPVTYHFMLVREPEIARQGVRIHSEGGPLWMTLSGAVPAAVTVDTLYFGDATMERSWRQDHLYRLNITLPAAARGEVVFTLCPQEEKQ